METKGCFRLCFLWQRAHTAWTMGFWLKSRKREAGLQGSGISSRIAHAWKHVRVCFCAFHDTNGDGKDRQHTRSHTQMYSDINRCKSAATPRLFIRHNSYCLFMFTHQYHLFPNEAGRKTRQEMLYRDMYLYTHKHLAHNNILCILRTSSQLSWKSADLHVRGVKPLLLHKKKNIWHVLLLSVLCIFEQIWL